MPLSFQPLSLHNPNQHTSSFRRNRQDFSNEYFNRIKTNQTNLGRTNSINHKRLYDGPETRSVLPENIVGLFSDSAERYDVFSSNRQKPKTKGTRSLGLNVAQYNAVLNNGPWDLQHQRSEKTRREAARKLIEDELRRRQQESLLGTASLPLLSAERTLVSTGIAVEEETTLDDELHRDVFYARDLLHAPQIIASKTKPGSPRKPEQSKVEYRLPSIANEKTKCRIKVTDRIISDRREKLRQQMLSRLETNQDQPRTKETQKLPNPNWVTVISPAPLATIPHTESPNVRKIVLSPSPPGRRKTTDLDSESRPNSSEHSGSRSEALYSLLPTIPESPRSARRTSQQSRDQPQSILKSPSSTNHKDDGKTVRFLETSYLERIRLFYTSPQTVNTAYSKHERKVTSVSFMGTEQSSEGKSSISSNLTTSDLTNTTSADESNDSTAIFPPWRALAQMIKTKTRVIKRKKKRKNKKKSDANQSVRPDSPRPTLLSGEENTELDSRIEEENETETEPTPDQSTERPRRNKGDGFVIVLKPDGALVEEKVGDDEISRPVTDAELSYRIREILSRPVFTARDSTSSTPDITSEKEKKQAEPTPRKKRDTALRRKSLPPTSTPFLPPELRAPKDNPFVTACVDWGVTPKDRRKSTSALKSSLDNNELEISPLLLAMRDCRYIRWSKKDEIIVEKLLELEDELLENPDGADSLLEELHQTRVMFAK